MRVATAPIRRDVDDQQALALDSIPQLGSLRAATADASVTHRGQPIRGPGDGYKAQRIFSGDGGRRAHTLHARAKAKAELEMVATAVAAGGVVAVPLPAEVTSFFGSHSSMEAAEPKDDGIFKKEKLDALLAKHRYYGLF